MKNNLRNNFQQSLTIFILATTMTSSFTAAQSQDSAARIRAAGWGLHNTGGTVIFDLSKVQTYRLQARVNEDIQLAPAVKGKKIRVAVLDTGVDTAHGLLKGQIYSNQVECEAYEKYKQCVDKTSAADCEDMLVTGENGVDAEENGYPADCRGWTTLGETTKQNIIGSPYFKDEIGHGTHVAGIIASVSKNIEIIPVQVIGAAPNEPVKPYSIDLSPNEDIRGGFGNDPTLAARIARGVIYAIHAKADVINLSIGWPDGQDAEIMREAIAEAQRQGIIIVAAAGNDSTTALLRPCQYAGVICVAAHRPDGSIAQFSNYGYGVDIAAPGASITSTIPHSVRSIRIPGESGIDVLSGTSQASPYVAGVVAEMLSRGIPSNEIYPRLILGAREVKSELPVLVGPTQIQPKLITSNEPYVKYVLSGLTDMKKSLAVTAQPLILNSTKDVHVINWDRKTADLGFSFPIKNFWQSVEGQSIEVQVAVKNPNKITPQITAVTTQDLTDSFLADEEKVVRVDMKIIDVTNPSESKLPSDLTFKVTVLINGKPQKSFETRAEVVAKIMKDDQSDDAQMIPVTGKLAQGMRKYLVDEVYDNRPDDRDYFGLTQTEKGFLISLMKYQNASYNISEVKKINFAGEIQNTTPYSRVRIDIDGDGKSEYVLGLQEFKTQEGRFSLGDYTLHLYIFDENMDLKKHVPFYDARSLIALDFKWIKIGKELRPAWVGMGKPIMKKHDILDFLSVNVDEKVSLGDTDIFFYYLDQNYRLATVENKGPYKIVDILQPQIEHVKKGTLPVLLAKNLGTEMKPSYINSFSIGWVTNGQLMQDAKSLNIDSSMDYRNLVDTGKDRSVNLSHTSDEFLGTFWFGFDTHQRQRVTMIDYKANTLFDRMLPNNRSEYDAPLRVRAAYSNQNEKGVFLITNTEIEYHDLVRQTTARSSLNKYTFYGDDLIVDVQFPISIANRNGGAKTPALFTTEGSGIAKGVKFLVPTAYGKPGNLEMVSPARLRFSAPVGCKATDAPIYVNGGYHMDYDCGSQILRYKLTY